MVVDPEFSVKLKLALHFIVVIPEYIQIEQYVH